MTSLNLSYGMVTNAGLRELTARKNLTKLWLFDTRVTDAGLKELAALPDLAVLTR
ncbi:MAG TPA: hypothetical protein VMZ71_06300 [Gemmataceae bacterium]|nr:hypothetical protein [Gemmataceae bacterium]